MTLADIFAVGSTFTDKDGKTYSLRPLTLYEQGEYQRHLEQRAHDAIDRSNDSDERKLRRQAQVDRDAAIGVYEWNGEAALQSLRTPSNLAKVLEIVCRGQGVTAEKAERIVAHSMVEVATKILGVAQKDKKKMAEVLESLGLSTDWLDAAQSAMSSANSPTPPGTTDSTTSEASPTTNSPSSTPSSAAPMG